MMDIKENIRIWIRRKFVSTNRDIISYTNPIKTDGFNIIRKILKENKILLYPHEAYQIYTIVKSLCEKRVCNLAEVGVYKGGSAKVICEVKGVSNLFLFDTFYGLPKPTELDVSFKEGDYPSKEKEVREYLKGYDNVKIVSGLFPNSVSEEIKKLKFMFVHLDVDLHNSVLNSLDFFYPRMEKGGIIISHDYSLKGIKKAIIDFLKDKPEVVIELNGHQCMIIKLNEK